LWKLGDRTAELVANFRSFDSTYGGKALFEQFDSDVQEQIQILLEQASDILDQAYKVLSRTLGSPLKPPGPFQRLRWSFSSKKRVEAIVREFSEYNDRIHENVKLWCLGTSIGVNLQHLQRLETDMNSRALGFDFDARLQLATQQNRTTQSLEMSGPQLHRGLVEKDIPLCTQWNARYLVDLQLNMALHLESPIPTKCTFRQDNGREIFWKHQQQIFQGLKQTYSNGLVRNNGPVLWQIALCYFMGFGIDQNTESAIKYAEMAKAEDHPVAKVFSDLVDPNKELPSAGTQDIYAKQMLSLMSADSALSDGMPPLVKACFLGQSAAVMDHLSDGAILNLSTLDGCSLFHWLFASQEQPFLKTFVKKVSGSQAGRAVNLPCSLPREPHKQWPLQLIGTPLAAAIAVNSLSTVRALLDLVADPFAPVYDSTQFPADDNRSLWTAFHMAVKYHCSDILLLLLNKTSPETQKYFPPLASALSFSTTLERLAMHGSGRNKQLDLTISIIQTIQSLSKASENGMTGLMQAIDFQDLDVVSALLRADPSLAQAPFRHPTNPQVFNMPIHFASQIAARRDTPETLLIPQLIDCYADCFKTKAAPQRDSAERTTLHLAVTGFSDRVTKWILEEGANLLEVEDIWGRTPLHYCAFTANCESLLKRGANINQCDWYGMTSLHRASYLGSVELVRCLLEWKPMLDLKNNQYGPALHCGVISGSLEVVDSLLEAGAIVDERDDQGNSAVHVAARLGLFKILRLLMELGANVAAFNYNGRNAKMIASDAGHVGILSILHSGWEASVNQRILDIEPDHRGNIYRPTSQKQTLGPDFLWDQNALANIMPEDPSFGSDTSGAVEAAEPEHTRTMQQKREDANELFQRLLDTYFGACPLTVESVTFLKRLLSVYVHGLVWRSVHATRITEIWARTTQDLINMMAYCANCRDAYFEYKDKAHGRNKAPIDAPELPSDLDRLSTEAEVAGSQNLSQEFEPDSVQGLSTIEQTSQESKKSAEISEPFDQRPSETINDNSCKEIGPQISQQSTESDHKSPISIAICCVSDMVVSTKPPGFFPNRNVRDFEYMIRWEMD
ncbi:ankyrin repeat domain-containing protein, partial [Fusarium bulbicola]